jgi:trk system potassium uptake protein TrkA
MGGPPIARWLCESLRDRAFSIRLFERDRARAAELSESLSWATVLASDPTDRAVFEEENLGQADLFISLLSSDEANIIAGAMAKVRGVAEVMTICQQSKYVDTILEIGVDKVFSPRSYAGDEIESFLDETPTRYMGSLAQGVVDVFRVRIGERSAAVGKPLQDLGLAPDWVVAALQRGRDVHVPTAQDIIDRGDVALVVGRHGTEETLGRLLIGTAP